MKEKTIFRTALEALYHSWMGLGLILGWINTRIILGILFYLILSPIGLILRLFGKQFLDLKTENRQKSHWKYQEAKEFIRENYEKQY